MQITPVAPAMNSGSGKPYHSAELVMGSGLDERSPVTGNYHQDLSAAGLTFLNSSQKEAQPLQVTLWGLCKVITHSMKMRYVTPGYSDHSWSVLQSDQPQHTWVHARFETRS